MVVHQVFAHILDGSVKNITVCDNYELANQLTKSIYGEDAVAQECTNYPCSIGDFYKNGSFYFADSEDKTKVGELIPRYNTAEEDAKEANEKADKLAISLSKISAELESIKSEK